MYIFNFFVKNFQPSTSSLKCGLTSTFIFALEIKFKKLITEKNEFLFSTEFFFKVENFIFI